MTTLYVTEQGAELHQHRQRLQVRKGQTLLGSVRLDHLRQVILAGHIHITAQAMRALLRHRVDTVFVTLGGNYVGRLATPIAAKPDLRRQQYRRLDDPRHALTLAQRFVAGKIHNQRTVIQRRQQRQSEESLGRALVMLRNLSEQLPDATTLDQVRGVEGRAAAVYFSVFALLLQAPGLVFPGRIKRPPPDPTNILLSLGYTLLTHQLIGNLEIAGLDPHFGALHAAQDGRPSLALDMIEEWRPVIVDSTVLTAFNTHAILPDEFFPAVDEPEDLLNDEQAVAVIDPTQPLRMSPTASKKWFALYERRLAELARYPPQDRQLSYRQILMEQVYRLAHWLRDEDDYQPFEMPL